MDNQFNMIQELLIKKAELNKGFPIRLTFQPQP